MLAGTKDIGMRIKGDVISVQFGDFDSVRMKPTQSHDVSADEAPVKKRSNSFLSL